MRERNPRLVLPDPERFVRTATVVLDANVLLGLYRLTVTARDNALAVLELPALRDRLWLPRQVVVEFYRNLPGLRGRVAAAYRKAGADLLSGAGTAKTSFAKESRSKEAKAEVAKLIDDGVHALVEALEGLAATHQPLAPDGTDPVLERIESLFARRTGAEPDDQTFRDRVEEFTTWRAPNQIPPGYKDSPEKHTPVLRAGDYLLWCELLDKAAESKTPFLFVTEDGKPDWWEGEGTPRPELGREFGRRNDAGYHQVTFEAFLSDAREHLGAEVSDETVKEVVAEREAAAADEAKRLMELWSLRTRENREWVQQGHGPLGTTVARAAAEISSAIERNPELLGAFESATLNRYPELRGALVQAALDHDPRVLSEFQRAAAEASPAVRSLLERASADMSPAFQGMLQGASADDLVLRDTARAARDALRDPAVGRALADFSSPAVRAALRSAPPPGRNRRPAKASDQREASGPAAARSETAKPSAEEPDTN